VQSSANAGPVPFGTEWRWYLALVQLTRDSLDGEARLAKFINCLAPARVSASLLSARPAAPPTAVRDLMAPAISGTPE
jgi:hypothetical protein